MEMTDTPPEGKADSESNLIKVHHVGVTAKLQSPLKTCLTNYCSSTETDGSQTYYHKNHCSSNAKYAKLKTEKGIIETDTTTPATTASDNSKVLYEMHASQGKDIKKAQKLTPSKIEFQLYTKKSHTRRAGRAYSKNHINFNRNRNAKKKKSQRRLFSKSTKRMSIFKRLRQSFQQLHSNSKLEGPSVDKIFDEFPEPINSKSSSTHQPLREVRLGIYPFDHGCPDYLKTHDAPPQIVSIYLAERSIYYANRFWGEFFGSIYIGVAFIITFALQTYRFILYCLINTLLVGFLHMTSDYFIKPLLTVLFNGFLQPVLTFCLNILSSIRDILVPVAEIVNNFMKPIATVGKSLRLIHVSYSKRNTTKTV